MIKSFWWRAGDVILKLYKNNKILFIKPEGKRSFGRPRRRWKDDIKINQREIVENVIV